MEKKQQILLGAVGVVVLLLLVWWMQSPQANPTNTTASENEGNTSTATGENAGTNADGSSVTVTPKLAYTAALKQYGANRIQFNQACVALPTSMAAKKGTQIMLDNRASVSRVVALDGNKYTIPAYDYTVVTLTTTASLPHNISVDCGNGQNNATIILQQ